MSNIHEECGVFGVFSPDNYDVARMTYYGLFSLQHRGQESCGIVVNDEKACLFWHGSPPIPPGLPARQRRPCRRMASSGAIRACSICW